MRGLFLPAASLLAAVCAIRTSDFAPLDALLLDHHQEDEPAVVAFSQAAEASMVTGKGSRCSVVGITDALQCGTTTITETIKDILKCGWNPCPYPLHWMKCPKICDISYTVPNSCDVKAECNYTMRVLVAGGAYVGDFENLSVTSLDYVGFNLIDTDPAVEAILNSTASHSFVNGMVQQVFDQAVVNVNGRLVGYKERFKEVLVEKVDSDAAKLLGYFDWVLGNNLSQLVEKVVPATMLHITGSKVKKTVKQQSVGVEGDPAEAVAGGNKSDDVHIDGDASIASETTMLLKATMEVPAIQSEVTKRACNSVSDSSLWWKRSLPGVILAAAMAWHLPKTAVAIAALSIVLGHPVVVENICHEAAPHVYSVANVSADIDPPAELKALGMTAKIPSNFAFDDKGALQVKVQGLPKNMMEVVLEKLIVNMGNQKMPVPLVIDGAHVVLYPNGSDVQLTNASWVELSGTVDVRCGFSCPEASVESTNATNDTNST